MEIFVDYLLYPWDRAWFSHISTNFLLTDDDANHRGSSTKINLDVCPVWIQHYDFVWDPSVVSWISILDVPPSSKRFLQFRDTKTPETQSVRGEDTSWMMVKHLQEPKRQVQVVFYQRIYSDVVQSVSFQLYFLSNPDPYHSFLCIVPQFLILRKKTHYDLCCRFVGKLPKLVYNCLPQDDKLAAHLLLEV